MSNAQLAVLCAAIFASQGDMDTAIACTFVAFLFAALTVPWSITFDRSRR